MGIDILVLSLKPFPKWLLPSHDSETLQCCLQHLEQNVCGASTSAIGRFASHLFSFFIFNNIRHPVINAIQLVISIGAKHHVVLVEMSIRTVGLGWLQNA